MAKSDIDAAVAAGNVKGRKVEGPGVTFTDASAAPSKNTKLMPKKNTQAGDPTGMGTKVNRQNIQQTPAMERNGARYTVKARIHKPTAPEAGMTQANGVVMPSVTNRDLKNFEGGEGYSYSR